MRVLLRLIDILLCENDPAFGRSCLSGARVGCYKEEVRATLAQLVERLIRNQQVAGSIPAGGSKFSVTNRGLKNIPRKTLFQEL
jgi:hypothetical protein